MIWENVTQFEQNFIAPQIFFGWYAYGLITPKNTHFRNGQIVSFSKTKKAFAYPSKSRTPNTREKPALLLLKLLGLALQFFIFRV